MALPPQAFNGAKNLTYLSNNLFSILPADVFNHIKSLKKFDLYLLIQFNLLKIMDSMD